MKTKLLSLLLALIIPVSLFGKIQDKAAKIIFEKEVHDFGKIKEEGGKVSYKFEFTNTGGSPLIISDVKASCGCTSPKWTRKPVMPGKTGFVSATFDPAHRPGNFNKSIVVRTNGVNSITILRIKGEVLPKKRSIADRYPTKMGELRLQSNHLPFVKVKHTTPKVDSLPVVNTSEELMRLSFTSVPKYLDIKTKPEVLKPGEEGHIWARFDPREANDWGFMIDRLKIQVNGKNVNRNLFSITAKIVEDFSVLSPEERKNAPQVKFESTTYDFGTAKQHTKVSYTFQFKNEGKRDLKIRKIRTTCGCTTVKPETTVIPSGEGSSFKAIFHTGGRSGYQRKLIYFITNDPERSTVRLTIKGKVLK